MSNNKKREVSDLDVVCEYMRKMSDNGLRVGQIFSNVFDLIAQESKDPFYIEDKAIIEYLKKYSQ